MPNGDNPFFGLGLLFQFLGFEQRIRHPSPSLTFERGAIRFAIIHDAWKLLGACPNLQYLSSPLISQCRFSIHPKDPDLGWSLRFAGWHAGFPVS